MTTMEGIGFGVFIVSTLGFAAWVIWLALKK